MPTSAGPNTSGESNIVFSYDTGDTTNSYRGEPTTNLALFGMDGFFNTDYPSNCSFSNDPGKGYKGRDAKKVVATGGQWNIYRYPRSGNYTATSSTQFTYSFKMKWADGHTPYFSNGYIYVDASVTYPDITVIPIDAGWYLCYCTYSGTSSPPWLTGFSTPDSGTCWICDWQLEAKSHPTPYAGAGATRSVTQGLLPLISNSTIDLSSVSYDSGAQIVFDGTDDTISIDSYAAIELVDNVSIEYVYMRLSTDPVLDVIANKYHSVGWELFCQTGATFALAGRNGDGTYYATSNAAYTIQNNQYYHLVAIKDGLSWRLYVNGALYASLTANTVGTWSNNGILQIGGEGAGYYPNMKLPIFKIYNTVLSADQIKQNYQKYKTRFNLS